MQANGKDFPQAFDAAKDKLRLREAPVQDLGGWGFHSDRGVGGTVEDFWRRVARVGRRSRQACRCNR
jgi:hypothetical protein